jgi:hypothetical protein
VGHGRPLSPGGRQPGYPLLGADPRAVRESAGGGRKPTAWCLNGAWVEAAVGLDEGSESAGRSPTYLIGSGLPAAHELRSAQAGLDGHRRPLARLPLLIAHGAS